MLSKTQSRFLHLFSIIIIAIAGCRLFPMSQGINGQPGNLVTNITSESEKMDHEEFQDGEVVSHDPTATFEPENEEGVLDDPRLFLSEKVAFEGIQFSYDPLIFNSVNLQIVEGQFMGKDYPPEATYPDHIRIEFEQNLPGFHFFDPIIRIYPVGEYATINEQALLTVQWLESALIDEPEGGVFIGLPSMSLWSGAPIFSVMVQYFDFQNGSGLRYLGIFGQDVFPPDNQHLVYIYQGITHDGLFYISAFLPITHPLLPDDGYSLVDDWENFFETWDELINQVYNDLDQAETEGFVPNLFGIDAMMASFSIE